MENNANADPRIAALPDIHGHAKGEHKPFAEERPIPYTARMLFLWFYHACRRSSPRFMMVADHINYLTFEDPAAVNLVRRALKLAQAGDLYGAAETAGVELVHAEVVSKGLRKGMRYSIGAEVDNDPRSRPDAQNIVDAMRPDGMIRSVHFLPIAHPQYGENWMWPFDNAEYKEFYETLGTDAVWDLYTETLLDAIEKLPGHIVGHFYVPAKFGHWPDDAKLESYEDRLIDACAERGMAIEINSRYFYKYYVGDDEQIARYRTAYLRLLGKAKAKGVMIAVGSDAHSPKDQGGAFDAVLALLDEADVNEIAFPINGRLARVALRATEEILRQHTAALAQAAPVERHVASELETNEADEPAEGGPNAVAVAAPAPARPRPKAKPRQPAAAATGVPDANASAEDALAAGAGLPSVAVADAPPIPETIVTVAETTAGESAASSGGALPVKAPRGRVRRPTRSAASATADANASEVSEATEGPHEAVLAAERIVAAAEPTAAGASAPATKASASKRKGDERVPDGPLAHDALAERSGAEKNPAPVKAAAVKAPAAKVAPAKPVVKKTGKAESKPVAAAKVAAPAKAASGKAAAPKAAQVKGVTVKSAAVKSVPVKSVPTKAAPAKAASAKAPPATKAPVKGAAPRTAAKPAKAIAKAAVPKKGSAKKAAPARAASKGAAKKRPAAKKAASAARPVAKKPTARATARPKMKAAKKPGATRRAPAAKSPTRSTAPAKRVAPKKAVAKKAVAKKKSGRSRR